MQPSPLSPAEDSEFSTPAPQRMNLPALHRGVAVALMATAMAFARPAAAQAPCTAPTPDCAVVGKLNISLGVGVGGRTNPIGGRSDLLLPLLPQISYYGKRFFIENLELGYTLYESDATSLSLIAAPGYDRAFFSSGDPQNIFIPQLIDFVATPVSEEGAAGETPIPRPRTTYLAGPEWTFSYRRLSGQLNVLREITGRHDGYEVRAALATPIIDAKASLTVSAGLTWKSAGLVRYYYGVEGRHEPGSAVNPFLKLGYSLPLSDRWRFHAFAHYEHLGAAIADSPIVTDSGVATAFAGFVVKLL
jgi:MipA family protein